VQVLLSLLLQSVSAVAATLVDDREITVHSTRQVADGRRALDRYLWGQDGFHAQRRLDDDSLCRTGSDDPL
jgi:hypothetical protein